MSDLIQSKEKGFVNFVNVAGPCVYFVIFYWHIGKSYFLILKKPENIS